MTQNPQVSVKKLKSNISTDLSILAEVECKKSDMDELRALKEAAEMLTEQDEFGFEVKPANSEFKVQKDESRTTITAWFERFNKQ